MAGSRNYPFYFLYVVEVRESDDYQFSPAMKSNLLIETWDNELQCGHWNESGTKATERRF